MHDNYASATFPPPREFQDSAHNALRDGVRDGHRLQCVISPSGSGKTYLGMRVIHEALLRGKQLFYSSDDPRLAREQWISCHSCHFEGEQDGRTWFFGFAGPRNTTSLRGMIETYPLRWSGEWNENVDVHEHA